MKSKSLEAKVLDARARVAALRGDERADYPSGPERTAYNKEFKNALKLLNKWEAAFAAPEYTGGGLRSAPRRVRPQVAIGGKAYNPDLTPAVAPPQPKKDQKFKRPKRLTPAAKAKHVSNAAKQKRMEEAIAALPVYTDAQREAIIAHRLALQQIHRQERLEVLARLAQIPVGRLGHQWEHSARHPGMVRLRPPTRI